MLQYIMYFILVLVQWSNFSIPGQPRYVSDNRLYSSVSLVGWSGEEVGGNGNRNKTVLVQWNIQKL